MAQLASQRKLKGQPGTKLQVTVKRPYVADSIKTFDLTRRKIQLPAVPYYGVLKDNIGYIYLTSFTDKAASEVKDALVELKKNPNVKSIVLDLRGNRGGLLEAAVRLWASLYPRTPKFCAPVAKAFLTKRCIRPHRLLSTLKFRWPYSSTGFGFQL